MQNVKLGTYIKNFTRVLTVSGQKKKNVGSDLDNIRNSIIVEENHSL